MAPPSGTRAPPKRASLAPYRLPKTMPFAKCAAFSAPPPQTPYTTSPTSSPSPTASAPPKTNSWPACGPSPPHTYSSPSCPALLPSTVISRPPSLQSFQHQPHTSLMLLPGPDFGPTRDASPSSPPHSPVSYQTAYLFLSIPSTSQTTHPPASLSTVAQTLLLPNLTRNLPYSCPYFIHLLQPPASA